MDTAKISIGCSQECPVGETLEFPLEVATDIEAIRGPTEALNVKQNNSLQGENPHLVTLRTATTPEDRDRVYRFRYSVYVIEQRKKLSYADHSRQILEDELDAWGTIFICEYGEEIIATLRANYASDGQFPAEFEEAYGLSVFNVFPLNAISFSSRFMVSRRWRGSPVTAQLLRSVYCSGRNRGSSFDLMNCAPSLVPFFERLGYRRYKTSFRDLDLGERVPLVLAVHDHEHLKSVRSPFLEECVPQENDLTRVRWAHQLFGWN